MQNVERSAYKVIKCNKQNERGSENETRENMVRNTNYNSGLLCDSGNLSWCFRDSFYIREGGCKIYFCGIVHFTFFIKYYLCYSGMGFEKNK